MVLNSSLTHTPVTALLILTSVISSSVLSTLDIKHLAPIKPLPHLWPYLQLSRFLTYQLAYTSATEVLVSVALLYQFRVLERLWGSRKYASFVTTILMINALLVPTAAIILKVITLGFYNYVPAGPTAVVFASLTAWVAEVPGLYRWRIITSSRGSAGTGEPGSLKGITLSDKSTTYLLAAQLALSQFPYSILPAISGWVLGTAWQSDLLPGGISRWRVPRWMVGESGKGKGRGQYEGLRRRLEAEGSTGDGMRNVADHARVEERRGLLGHIGSYFSGQ